MSPSPDRSHYGYSIYADPNTAQGFDQSRFGGEIGQLVATAQEHVLADFLGDLHNSNALDVGCGTGRAALALAKLGASVIGVDSSPEMLRVGRSNAAIAGLPIEFCPGDANSLAFTDRSFDTVISLRVLMHTPDWRRCLAEMCRVSRQRVVFDYPPLVSASLLQMMLRRLASLFGRRVETYHVISTAAVRAALNANGYCITRLHRQFVLPISLHRWIDSRSFTERSEAALAALGLLGLFGSPVTILAERGLGGIRR